jgi:diaminopimelate epimerase
MQFEFYKIQGAGNDFIFIDNRDGKFKENDPLFVKHLCKSHTGIGSDGLLLLENSQFADFKMRYFNSDGYESEMCANGSRCTCYMAYLLGIIDKKHSFEAGDGVHSGEIIDTEKVSVEVILKKETNLLTFPVDFELPNSISFIDFLNTGVPHLILECEDIDLVPVDDIGKALRFHRYYMPEGTNVNFVEKKETNNSIELKVRTFERGVDAETLSCGSGVTAAAISFYKRLKPKSKNIYITTRGGYLVVTLSDDFESIYLEGPVKIIFKGTYIEEEGFQ